MTKSSQATMRIAPGNETEMSSKKELERELWESKARVVSLEEQVVLARLDKQELQLQVNKLQDAVLSIQAPEAYRDQRVKEYEEDSIPVSAEEKEKRDIQAKVYRDYMNGMEGPLFRGPEELDDLLESSLLRGDHSPSSLHGNNES